MALFDREERERERKEQERIEYIRENVNPTYKLSKREALRYAAKMGASDSFRGIRQFFSNDDEVIENKDDDLKELNIVKMNVYGIPLDVCYQSMMSIIDSSLNITEVSE